MRAPAFRSARGEDIRAVLELWRSSGGAEGATDTEASLERLLARDPDALLLAEDEDGALVGSLIAAWDGWRANLYRLVVREDRRREGLATAILQRGERRLLALGAVRLTALVDAEDGRATAFWEAAGYGHQRERARFIKPAPR